MTDRYFTGARRRKFWTFQNFRTATAATGAQWRSAAFTHGCVCALWRSTAFIHGFWTAAERRQKPPMCNSGLKGTPGNKPKPAQVMTRVPNVILCHQTSMNYDLIFRYQFGTKPLSVPMLFYWKVKPGTTFWWNLNKNTVFFMQENQYENVSCKIATILSWPLCIQ